MASYLATIAIGPYREVVDETPTGFPISYWVMPRDRDVLDKLISDGDAALPWLEEHVGRYPFSSLGVVVVGGNSGMETQTMVTMSRGAVLRPDAVLLHEFAHMWFGNSVSPTDWQGMWLNEGWAMYMQQWFERDTGMPVYGGGIEQWRAYDNPSRRLAGPPGDYDPAWFGDSNVYLGPAMMLDRIRQRIGDAAFEDLVRSYVREFAGEHVDRATFTTWVEDETGQDLEPLIDLWLDSPRTPR
jgi:aminopeptidase N